MLPHYGVPSARVLCSVAPSTPCSNRYFLLQHEALMWCQSTYMVVLSTPHSSAGTCTGEQSMHIVLHGTHIVILGRLASNKYFILQSIDVQ